VSLDETQGAKDMRWRSIGHYQRNGMELARGIEPPTYGLQRRTRQKVKVALTRMNSWVCATGQAWRTFLELHLIAWGVMGLR